MMQEFTTTVTRKGQITIPVEIRRILGLKKGDKVAVFLPDPAKFEAILRPVESVAMKTYGVMPGHGRPPTPQEMRQAFIDGIVDEAIAEGAVEAPDHP